MTRRREIVDIQKMDIADITHSQMLDHLNVETDPSQGCMTRYRETVDIQ